MKTNPVITEYNSSIYYIDKMNKISGERKKLNYIFSVDWKERKNLEREEKSHRKKTICNTLLGF